MTASIFSPVHGSRLPERIPLPITVSFGTPMPADTPAHQVRAAIRDLDMQAWNHRKADRRPLHHDFIRQARKHMFRLGLADPLRPLYSPHARGGQPAGLRMASAGTAANVGTVMPRARRGRRS
ncbi:MAG: hypothetical protein U0794_00940 [Isosphaeraceae bacterium]